MLPQDPAILLSLVNTHLRDSGCTLEELCLEWDVDRGELEGRLAPLGYRYDPEHRRFV